MFGTVCWMIGSWRILRRCLPGGLAAVAIVGNAPASDRGRPSGAQHSEDPKHSDRAETTSPSEPTIDEAPPSAPATHLHANAFLVWIYKNPVRDPAPIGYLRAGQSAALRGDEPVSKKGCGGGWYAIHPAGFVCLDRRATLSPTRYSENMAQLSPANGSFPFDYALSMGTPSYRRVPTPSEWEQRERKYGSKTRRPLPPHWRGHEELVTDRELPTEPVPRFLAERGSVSRENETRLVRREVPFGSMLAVTAAFESNGRVFLQSADGTLVPRDRMRLFARSSFEGVPLPAGSGMPLGWPKRSARKFVLHEEGECSLGREHRAGNALEPEPPTLPKCCLIRSSEDAPPRVALQLSGRSIRIGPKRFLEVEAQLNSDGSPFQPTRSYWLAQDDLYVAHRREPPPSLGAATEEGQAPKWIHFSIGNGTLVAYAGREPVFATLASPGIGGQPKRGGDPLSDRTTPLGIYRIHFKHHSDDMSPEHGEHRSFWIADVPYAMYFKQPFAIHAAYWHESFGEPMSGGCINVSPKDAAYLFSWTDPQLPSGWYGVGAGRDFGLGTTVVIDR